MEANKAQINNAVDISARYGDCASLAKPGNGIVPPNVYGHASVTAKMSTQTHE